MSNKLSLILLPILFFPFFTECCVLVGTDCSDDPSCGPYKHCEKTGTWLVSTITCVCVAIDCANFNYDTGVCYVCTNNKALTSGGSYCVDKIAYCQTYADTIPVNCTSCITGYAAAEDGNDCVVAIENCQFYLDNGNCRKCVEGYQVWNGNMCISPISHCSIADPNDPRKCQICDSDYFLSETMEHCVAKITNCIKYSDLGTCLICDPESNTTLTQTGAKCVDKIEHCFAYNDSTGLCMSCEGNYSQTETGKKCTKYEPYCAVFDDETGLCKGCVQGYVITASLSCELNISHCNNYTSSDCQICDQGFTPSESGIFCAPNIPNCQNYSDTGLCTECNGGFNLSQTGKSCVQTIQDCSLYSDNQTCLGCTPTLELSKAGLRCNQFILNCLVYSDNDHDGLFCEQCNDGYNLTQKGTVCSSMIKGCSKLQPDQRLCSECDPGLSPTENGRKCVVSISDCSTYDDDFGDCKQCVAPFQLFSSEDLGSYCYQPVDSCEIFTPDRLKCQICSDNLQPSVNLVRCATPISNCLSYPDDQNSDACSRCDSDYVYSAALQQCVSNYTSEANSESESTTNHLIEIVVPCVVGGGLILVFLFLFCYFKRRKEQNRVPFEGVYANLDSYNFSLSESSVGTNTETLSISNAIQKIAEFIETQKLRLEHFVFEIIENSQAFGSEPQVKMMEKIGKGGFGTVYRSVDNVGNFHALKIFIDKNGNDVLIDQDLNRLKEMLKEKLHLRELKHENIITMSGVAFCFKPEKLLLGLVEPLLQYDLKSFLEIKRNLPLTRRLEVILNVANGLHYMHYRKFSHNDIKPQNVLVNWENDAGKIEVKISDFGTMQKHLELQNDDIGVTLEYASPERIQRFFFQRPLKREDYLRSDIWSFGCLLMKVFAENPSEKFKFPWSGQLSNRRDDNLDQIKEAIRQILDDEEGKEKEYCNNGFIKAEIRQIINQCLQFKGEKRARIEQIIEKLRKVKDNN